MRFSINIFERGEGDDEDELQDLASRKTPGTLGPMDKFASSISAETCLSPGMTQSRSSIMTDAWTDRKRRNIMNLCVNSNMGIAFLSRESSDEAHTSELIFGPQMSSE